MTEQPDWIDELAIDLGGVTGILEGSDYVAHIIREHFLKAAKCDHCGGSGSLQWAHGGRAGCHRCRGSGYVVPETKGIDR